MKWIAVAIVAAGALIGGAVLMSNGNDPEPKSPGSSATTSSSTNLIQGEIVEVLLGSCSLPEADYSSQRIRFFDNEDRTSPLVEVAIDPPELRTGARCFVVTTFSGQVPEPPSGNYLVERQTSLGSACTVVGLFELEEQDFRWRPTFAFEPGQTDCFDYYAGGSDVEAKATDGDCPAAMQGWVDRAAEGGNNPAVVDDVTEGVSALLGEVPDSFWPTIGGIQSGEVSGQEMVEEIARWCTA